MRALIIAVAPDENATGEGSRAGGKVAAGTGASPRRAAIRSGSSSVLSVFTSSAGRVAPPSTWRLRTAGCPAARQCLARRRNRHSPYSTERTGRSAGPEWPEHHAERLRTPSGWSVEAARAPLGTPVSPDFASGIAACVMIVRAAFVAGIRQVQGQVRPRRPTSSSSARTCGWRRIPSLPGSLPPRPPAPPVLLLLCSDGHDQPPRASAGVVLRSAAVGCSVEPAFPCPARAVMGAHAMTAASPTRTQVAHPPDWYEKQTLSTDRASSVH